MKSKNIVWQDGHITRETRQDFFGHSAATLWMTGLSGAGKSTLAFATESRLLSMGIACFVLDGDNVRHGLNRDLGFSPEDRSENIRRVAEVARLMNEAGLIVVTSFISPYREDRELARTIIGADRFLEVHMATPLEVCEQRDVKGLYQRARSGEVKEFTGINSPYEPPLDPALTVNTQQYDINSSVDMLVEMLKSNIAISNQQG
ncbi:adenylyl-sulfate kinase [Pseudomonas sp. BN415]|uniref:adenylyl-sulfate kinase n=1 Tax=Pseudomonas sp. BN415 TaxID=2567889 RepID=UPI002455206E|nr:adenylyl-sulfate kinase [Pseudomonas sp. BN415]MDH4584224.1 adenylyl-sulfate kinase [Pseudomonas sp. BN415]